VIFIKSKQITSDSSFDTFEDAFHSSLQHAITHRRPALRTFSKLSQRPRKSHKKSSDMTSHSQSAMVFENHIYLAIALSDNAADTQELPLICLMIQLVTFRSIDRRVQDHLAQHSASFHQNYTSMGMALTLQQSLLHKITSAFACPEYSIILQLGKQKMMLD
jgi:hypothetical protein